MAKEKKKEKKPDPVATSIAKIQAAYEMGRRLNVEFARREAKLAKEGKTKYEQDIVGSLADDHGINFDIARKRKDFANTFSEKELDELLALMEQHKWPVSESSIHRLMSVRDKRSRRSLQRRAAKGRWSRLELNRRIRIKCGTRRSGGRNPKQTDDAELFKAELQTACIKFCRLIEANQTEDDDGRHSLDHLTMDPNLAKQALPPIDRKLPSRSMARA